MVGFFFFFFAEINQMDYIKSLYLSIYPSTSAPIEPQVSSYSRGCLPPSPSLPSPHLTSPHPVSVSASSTSRLMDRAEDACGAKGGRGVGIGVEGEGGNSRVGLRGRGGGGLKGDFWVEVRAFLSS